jgi:hypothetical protein
MTMPGPNRISTAAMAADGTWSAERRCRRAATARGPGDRRGRDGRAVAAGSENQQIHAALRAADGTWGAEQRIEANPPATPNTLDVVSQRIGTLLARQAIRTSVTAGATPGATTTVALKLSAAIREKLAKLPSLTVTITTSFTDAAGQRHTTTATLTSKREVRRRNGPGGGGGPGASPPTATGPRLRPGSSGLGVRGERRRAPARQAPSRAARRGEAARKRCPAIPTRWCPAAWT